MRGGVTSATRFRAIKSTPPLISQRAEPLTASPKGEAKAAGKILYFRQLFALFLNFLLHHHFFQRQNCGGFGAEGADAEL